MSGNVNKGPFIQTVNATVFVPFKNGFITDLWFCLHAFNFPVAVYGWNNAISLVCGNMILWYVFSNGFRKKLVAVM